MKSKFQVLRLRSSILVGGLLTALLAASATGLAQRQKGLAVDPEDPTLKLFQWLDQNHGGKLDGFYLLADVYKDPADPSADLQRILRVEYDKNRAFGRLSVYVRSVGKITEDHLKSYTPKDFYEFGQMDLEKFIKTDPGPLGRQGDLYLRATEDRPLSTAPVTDEVRKDYAGLIVQHILPALQKK